MLNRLDSRLLCESAFEAVWQGKQEGEPGTALPTTFPSRDALVAAGYSTKEDLDGAHAVELEKTVGLSKRDAQAVLKALAAI